MRLGKRVFLEIGGCLKGSLVSFRKEVVCGINGFRERWLVVIVKRGCWGVRGFRFEVSIISD